MKTITLDKTQAETLVVQLENKGDGYNIGQLRQLGRVLDVFEAATAIDDKLGIKLEDADYTFLKEIWDATANYRGGARKLVLGIDDAIQGAE